MGKRNDIRDCPNNQANDSRYSKVNYQIGIKFQTDILTKKTRKDSPCGSHPSMGILLRRFNRPARQNPDQMGPVFGGGVHVGVQALGLG